MIPVDTEQHHYCFLVDRPKRLLWCCGRARCDMRRSPCRCNRHMLVKKMKHVAGDLEVHVKPFGGLGVWGLSPCRSLAAGGTAAECVYVRRRVIHGSDEYVVRKHPKCSTRTSSQRNAGRTNILFRRCSQYTGSMSGPGFGAAYTACAPKPFGVGSCAYCPYPQYG